MIGEKHVFLTLHPFIISHTNLYKQVTLEIEKYPESEKRDALTISELKTCFKAILAKYEKDKIVIKFEDQHKHRTDIIYGLEQIYKILFKYANKNKTLQKQITEYYDFLLNKQKKLECESERQKLEENKRQQKKTERIKREREEDEGIKRNEKERRIMKKASAPPNSYYIVERRQKEDDAARVIQRAWCKYRIMKNLRDIVNSDFQEEDSRIDDLKEKLRARGAEEKKSRLTESNLINERINKSLKPEPEQEGSSKKHCCSLM